MPALPPAILVHLAAAAIALVLGVLVLAMRKGTPAHRVIGRYWVAAMVVLAVGSFWITRDGALSWIHGLSAFTLASLAAAVWAIRRRYVRTHRMAMLGTLAGFMIAGAFALAPGRLLGTLVW